MGKVSPFQEESREVGEETQSLGTWDPEDRSRPGQREGRRQRPLEEVS